MCAWSKDQRTAVLEQKVYKRLVFLLKRVFFRLLRSFQQSGNAQKAFSFLPNLQTRAIHLDDTIKYDFIFNNTLNKDYRLVHQGQLRGLEIRYRFKKYQKWKPFSNSGADCDDMLNLYGFNTYLIKANK